jgi:hypothetical protein
MNILPLIAGFVGNPHIVAATEPDYILPIPQTQTTFPDPLPHYLPRTVKVPSASFPTTDIASANAGRFSVSMKGMRRDLRRAGGKAEWLVRDVETAIVEWLMQGGTVLRPNNVEENDLNSGRTVGNSGTIVEVSRTPLQLIWRIPDDAFARYVVHCCARYHEVVSFSGFFLIFFTFRNELFFLGKGTDQNRLTYLLRPNVTRPDRRTLAALETPPVTEIEISSNPDTDIDSDFVSERDLESDIELDHKANLPSIAEGPSLHVQHEDDLSTFADCEEAEFLDADLDSGSEIGSGLEESVDILQARLETLSVDPALVQPLVPSVLAEQPSRMDEDPDTTLQGILRQTPPTDSPRRRRWAAARSPSSPSLSPVRLRRRRRAAPKKRLALNFQTHKSFYDYLFR